MLGSYVKTNLNLFIIIILIISLLTIRIFIFDIFIDENDTKDVDYINDFEKLERPEGLNITGVLIGSEILNKSLFYKNKQFDYITDIVELDLDPDPGLEIGLASTNGATFINNNSDTISKVMFESWLNHVEIIDINNDNTYEFMNRGSWLSGASTYDHHGEEIWTYTYEDRGTDDACAGDIDNDGQLEFVVGFNGGGGVHLLDENGDNVWVKPDGNVWHVEMVDTNNDSTFEIVHSNVSGDITVRNGKGKVISKNEVSPHHYLSDFSISSWPGSNDSKYIISCDEVGIWIINFSGETVIQLKAPRCEDLGFARGLPVKLMNDQPEYFAVIVAYKNWERSILYLYNITNDLVYQEILPEVCNSIAAVTLNDPETEVLLIGGEGEVWKYEPV